MRIAKGNLKKQSQFSEGQNDVKSVIVMVYGDFGMLRLRENKANSKPNKANPSGTNCRTVLIKSVRVYSCSPHEIGKTVISRGKFVVNLKKQTQFAGGGNKRKVNY